MTSFEQKPIGEIVAEDYRTALFSNNLDSSIAAEVKKFG